MSDWERIKIRDQIRLSAATHTLLLRVPGVQGMPLLGLEIEALAMKRDPPRDEERGRKRRADSTWDTWEAIVAECNRSRSSSLESLHVAPRAKPQNTTKKEARERETGVGISGLQDEGREVFGPRACKRVKHEEADVKPFEALNWGAAESTNGGRTTIDIDLLYG